MSVRAASDVPTTTRKKTPKAAGVPHARITSTVSAETMARNAPVLSAVAATVAITDQVKMTSALERSEQ